jgi:hypothetical protein
LRFCFERADPRTAQEAIGPAQRFALELLRDPSVILPEGAERAEEALSVARGTAVRRALPVSWERPYRDQYEAVRHEFEKQGFAVRIVEPAPFEERGTDVVYNIALLMATPEVVIHLGEQLADHVLDILEAVLIAYLIGRVKVGPKQGTPRRAQILGPDGRVLRNVQLPPGDEAAGDEDD